MTFRQLKYFSVIYECKSLAKASQKLYISQQGLSRILASLESEVGGLFIRLHHGLEPTPFGTVLYDACQPVLHEMLELERVISDYSRLCSKQLFIGLVGGTRYLNTISARQIWQQKLALTFPDTQFNARELSYAQGIEMFGEKKLDMITYSDYEAADSFSQFALRTWNRVLLVPKGHPLYEEKQVSPKVLKDEHLILYINAHANNKLLRYCEENNCRPAEIIYLSDTLYMYDACQKAGCLGLTIDGYYSTALSPQFPALRTIPFTEIFLPYTVSVLFHSDHPMANILNVLAEEMKTFFHSCEG